MKEMEYYDELNAAEELAGQMTIVSLLWVTGLIPNTNGNESLPL